MYEVSVLDVTLLEQRTLDLLADFVEPKFRCCLKGTHPDGITDTLTVAVSASEQGNYIGLLLASYIPILHIAELHVVSLVEHHQNQPLIIHMIQTLEEKLRELLCITISFVFPEDHPLFSLFMAAFPLLHWSSPQPFMIRYFFHAYSFAPPWFLKHYPLPKHLHLFPWTELTHQERVTLIQQQEHGLIPAYIFPLFKEEELIEPSNSLGLRYKNSVIGWMVTHRIATDILRYNDFYILPEFRNCGCAMSLLCHSIKLQQKSPYPWSVADVSLMHSDPRWLKFAKQRLLPYTYKTLSSYIVTRLLTK